MSTQLSNVIPEKISIKSIVVFNCQIQAGELYLEQPVRWNKVNVHTKYEFSFNIEKKLSRLRLHMICNTFENEHELELTGEFGIEYFFEIENLDDLIFEEESENKIDARLMVTLISLGFSTSRGVVLEKTQNTFLKGIILPVIDPVELLRQGEK